MSTTFINNIEGANAAAVEYQRRLAIDEAKKERHDNYVNDLEAAARRAEAVIQADFGVTTTVTLTGFHVCLGNDYRGTATINGHRVLVEFWESDYGHRSILPPMIRRVRLALPGRPRRWFRGRSKPQLLTPATLAQLLS